MVAALAGMQPGDGVNPTVVDAMHEVGIDLIQERPRQLTPRCGRTPTA
jgi:protein-tyrosine-phosphatase